MLDSFYLKNMPSSEAVSFTFEEESLQYISNTSLVAMSEGVEHLGIAVYINGDSPPSCCNIQGIPISRAIVSVFIQPVDLIPKEIRVIHKCSWSHWSNPIKNGIKTSFATTWNLKNKFYIYIKIECSHLASGCERTYYHRCSGHICDPPNQAQTLPHPEERAGDCRWQTWRSSHVRCGSTPAHGLFHVQLLSTTWSHHIPWWWWPIPSR